jgi:hypothetical protein
MRECSKALMREASVSWTPAALDGFDLTYARDLEVWSSPPPLASAGPGFTASQLGGQVAFTLDQYSQFWNRFQARGIA